MSDIKPRTHGSLYALAIGDAYGVGFEFMEPKQITTAYPQMPDHSVGGGPFDFDKGEFSDDTEMAVLTIASLQKHQNLDTEHLKKLYTLWACIAKDIGTQTRFALIDNEMDPNGEGNGALMRILPAAAYLHETLGWEISRIKEAIRHISAITHDNPTVHEINDFFIDVMFKNPIDSYKDLIKAFKKSKGNNAWVMNTARIVWKVYALGDMPLLEGFWEIIKYGGDTDTACAIYGAIRGYQNPTLLNTIEMNKMLSPVSIKQLEQFCTTDLHWYTTESATSQLIAGQYPGSSGRVLHTLKMDQFNLLNIDSSINLMEPDELERFTPYYRALKHISPNLQMHTMPIKDMDIPSDELLDTIVTTIDQKLAQGKRVYVHCWGGHGRTGTIIGAWLVKHGLNSAQALEQIKRQRLLTPFGDAPSPQTLEQIEVIQKYSTKLEKR